MSEKLLVHKVSQMMETRVRIFDTCVCKKANLARFRAKKFHPHKPKTFLKANKFRYRTVFETIQIPKLKNIKKLN